VPSDQEPQTYRVVFDATMDEVVDVNLLLFRTSNAGRRWKRDAIVIAALGSGLGVFGCLALTGQVPHTYAAVAGLIVGGTVGALYGPVYDRGVLNRTERLIHERVGDGPFTCVMEARPEGLRTEMRGVTTTTSWTLLRGVAETPRGIELQFQDGIAVVRDRAFAGVQARSAFLQRIRELQAAVN
jgi:hypothetical protein